MRFEVMRALRQGQAAIFNFTQDMCGEARVVERAFDLGASALSEATRLVGKPSTSSQLEDDASLDHYVQINNLRQSHLIHA